MAMGARFGVRRMARFLGKALPWTIVFLALSIVALVVFFALYSRTDSFRNLLREQVVSAVSGALRGNVQLAEIDGSIWSHLTLHDVSAGIDGDTVVQIDEVRIRYSLMSLLTGELAISELSLVQPAVHAREGDDGAWNLVTAFTPRGSGKPAEKPQEEKGGGLPIAISLADVSIEDGQLDVSPRTEPRRTYRIEDLTLKGSARIGSEKILAKVRELSANLDGKDVPSVRLAVSGTYDQNTNRTRIEVEKVDLESAQSRVHLHGTVGSLGELKLDANLDVERLSSEEMQQLLPSWPLRSDLTGSLRASGDRDDLTAELSARAGDAKVEANAWSDLSGEEIRYRGDATFRDIEPAHLLGRGDFGGVLSGKVHAEGTGTDPTATKAHAEVTAKSLQVSGKPLGDLQLVASLQDGVASVRGDLSGAGTAHLDGTLQIAAQKYDLRVNVRGVDIGRSSLAGKALASDVNLEATIEGRGFHPKTMELRADVDLDVSEIGPLSIDKGRLVARVSGGRVDLDTLELHAAGTDLSASGRIGLAAEAPTDLQLVLDSPDVRPWLKLVGQHGSGSLQADLSASGTRSSLDAKGTIDAAKVRVGTTEVASLHAVLDVAGLTSGTPEGRIDTSLQGLNAGIDVSSADVGVDVRSRDGTPAADVTLEAQLKGGYAQRLQAGVVVEDERITVDLRGLSLQVPNGTWQLDHPAQIVRADGEITVTDLRLANGEQSVTANGTFGRPGESLDVHVRQVTLQSFRQFTGDTLTDLGGVLEADLELRGTAEAPQPSGEVRLRDGRVGVKRLGVTVHSIGLTARLKPEQIDLDLTARSEDGSLQGRGQVHLVDYEPDNVDVQVDLDHWPVMKTPRYQAKIGGSLSVGGSLSGPAIEGEVDVVEASLRPELTLPGSGGPPPRDDTIEVVGEGETEARGGAKASGEKGEVQSDVLKQAEIDLRVVIKRNVWVKKDNSAVDLTGDVRIEKKRGEKDLTLTGEVRVRHGWIYLYGRRFDPERAVVTFTGGREIDPSLDVVLRSRVGEYEVRTIVKGTASKPKLSFESDPSLDDADILALLMFGRPVHQLDEGEKTSLEQQAASFAAGYAANKISQQLGDVLGFQVSEIDVTEGKLGIGRYLTPKTYVSIIQSLSGGREIDVDYYFTPSWTVRGSTDSEGQSGLDVFWKKEY